MTTDFLPLSKLASDSSRQTDKPQLNKNDKKLSSNVKQEDKN
jgi:hypothetical protein